MTFKDLKKRVSLEAATTTQQQSKLLEVCKDKPFWIWNIEEHKQEDIKTNGDCCFSHIIGLPQKDGIESLSMTIKKESLILYLLIMVTPTLLTRNIFG